MRDVSLWRALACRTLCDGSGMALGRPEVSCSVVLSERVAIGEAAGSCGSRLTGVAGATAGTAVGWVDLGAAIPL